MAALPVIAAAMNLVIAMAQLPSSAAMMTRVETELDMPGITFPSIPGVVKSCRPFNGLPGEPEEGNGDQNGLKDKDYDQVNSVSGRIARCFLVSADLSLDVD